ncbi:MAG: redoxin family protein [Bacteroidia bacterium]|nr:redoxin family protein [Bacteroidia bacterium]
MKKLFLLATGITATISSAFMLAPAFDELALNAPVPEAGYKMKDVSGKEVSLDEAKTAKGLLVIFSCNTCPYVKLSETRIKEYSELCATNGIGCIIVNSNEAQRTEEDSFDAMTKYYTAQKLKCFYTVDAGSKLANAFGATRTPQCFLFNAKGLVYKGAIDDNVKDPTAVRETYLRDAINAVVKNTVPAKQETKSIGCTIKRVE